MPDIIKKVFGDETTADFKFELTGTYRKWTYCVQYRETDFNFVSRLMEEEGISTTSSTPTATTPWCSPIPRASTRRRPATRTIPFVSPEQVVRPELEHISSWDFSREIQPGVYVHDDYDLERPSVELKTQKVLPRTYTPSDYEVYDYPGHYLQKPDGEQYAGVRIDEFGSQFETAQAVTNAKGMCVGSLFTLEQCPREDQNREHLIVAASYDLEFSDYEAMPEGAGTELPVQLRRDVERAAVPAAAQHAEAVRAGAADRGGRRAGRRRDLHRQVRPREGAVPLGPLRQEGREQLVLDPRVAAVGRQGLGRRSRRRASARR